jgi:outer membrane protein assembly factor BamB
MANGTAARKPMRWWLPAGILVLEALVIAYLNLSGSIEDFGLLPAPLTLMSLVLTLLLLAGWFLFLSGFRRRTRLLGVTALVAVLATLYFTLRIDGFSGDMVPQLAWSWQPKKDRLLDDLPEPAGARVDLATTSAGDFPQFLGPQRRAVVTGVRLDRDWSARPPRPLWRQPIGAGWSAFAVVGHSAVTQEQRGDKELVVCYDLLTGRVQWTHTDRARFSEVMGGDGPRATPTLAGGRVYALGATGLLHCLDGATGAVVWSRDVLADHQTSNLPWGKSSSPLVFDDRVVVSLGESTDRCLAAYHRDTGQPLWHAGRDKASYSSPVLATLAGKRQIVSVNAQSVTAHDPADGQILWEYAWPGEMPKCSQPVPLDGDRVFLSTGYGIGCVLLQVKADGDRLAVTEIWSNRNLKTRFTNVAVRNGFVYGLDDGILACLDLATGKRKWKDGRYGHGQVLLVEDVLLVQAESGDVVLIEADPEAHRERARFAALRGKTWNNPALAGRYLVVRNDQEAACYELPLQQGQPLAAGE